MNLALNPLFSRHSPAPKPHLLCRPPLPVNLRRFNPHNALSQDTKLLRVPELFTRQIARK